MSSTEGQRTVDNIRKQTFRRMPPHRTAPHPTEPHRTKQHRTSSRWSVPSGVTNVYHDLGLVLLRGALEISHPWNSFCWILPEVRSRGKAMCILPKCAVVTVARLYVLLDRPSTQRAPQNVQIVVNHVSPRTQSHETCLTFSSALVAYLA